MRLFVLVFCILSAWSPLVRAQENVYEAEDVVVTASRYDGSTQLNFTNITGEQLQLREPDQELPLLLQSVPGVFSYSDAGSGLGYTYLKIRGFDQRRVGVLLNGIPLNDPEDHQVWWVDMPDLAASVQDIQVQRGITNSVGGMTAIGGTVNIITADPSLRPQGLLSLNTGSYGFARQMISYQTGRRGKFSSLARLSRQESDGFRDRSGHEGWAAYWSGQFRTERSTTQLNIYTGKELTHHAWDAVPESVLANDRRANIETYHNAVDDFRQPHYEAHHTLYLSDALSLTNRIYYIQGEGFYENFKENEQAWGYSLDRLAGIDPDTELDLIRRKWVRKDHLGWVPNLAWQQGDHGRLLVGGDWYTFHSDHWGDVLWAEGLTPADFTEEYKYHHYTGDKDAFSLYANQRFGVGGGLILTGDLHYQHKKYRFRQHRVKNFSGELLNAYTVTWDFFNPKGAVNWQIPGEVAGGRLQVYGSLGVNHREPTDGELFDTWLSGSDLGVQPLFTTARKVPGSDGEVAYLEWTGPLVHEEKVVDYEAGLAWQNAALSLTVGGYWMDFTNEIVPYGGVGEDGSSIRGNAGKTLHRGVELGLRAQLAGNHDLTVAASRSWDEFETFLYTDWTGASKDCSGNPIALFPDYLLLAGWEADWTSALKTRLRLRSTGRQYLDNEGDADRTIDPWTTVDLSLWLDLAELGGTNWAGATVFAHVRNLGDSQYETWGYWYEENWYTPAAGRNYSLGMELSF